MKQTSSQEWVRKGLWNILEQGSTRALDALVSLGLIAGLRPEIFSEVAQAQALVAPALLLFVSSETILYRDYGTWRDEGMPALAKKLWALRWVAWFKPILGVFVALGISWIAPAVSLEALLWALGLALIPQVTGVDREYLRLSLSLKRLNLVTWVQKLGLLLGVWFSLQSSDPLWGLSVTAFAVMVGSALLVYFLSLERLRLDGLQPGASVFPKVREALAINYQALVQFSLLTHLHGVALGAIATLDVLIFGFLGTAGASDTAVTLGLYAATLRLANLTQALPLALSNLMGVWLGRKSQSERTQEGHTSETSRVLRLSGALGLVALVQSLVVWLLAPWLIELLSRGRWTQEQQSEMLSWLPGLLVASSLLCVAQTLSAWRFVRESLPKLIGTLTLPWAIGSGVAMWLSITQWGWMGGVYGSVLSALLFVVLTLIPVFFKRS
jgi:hypothetical protein